MDQVLDFKYKDWDWHQDDATTSTSALDYTSTSDLHDAPTTALHDTSTSAMLETTNSNIANITDDQITSIIRDGRNQQTMAKYQWAATKFGDWLKSSNIEPQEMWSYTSEQISSLVSRFIVTMQRTHTSWKPKTLYELTLSLHQHINESRLTKKLSRISLMSDSEPYRINK